MFEDQTVELLPARTVMSSWGGGGGGGRSGGGGGRGGDAVAVSAAATIIVEGNVIGGTFTATSGVATAMGGAGGAGSFTGAPAASPVVPDH
jgi:hypothetical protein